MYRMIMILLAAAAALMVLIFLVFTPDASTGQKENAHLIGASYMTMNNEFYEILNEQISRKGRSNRSKVCWTKGSMY